MPKSSEFYTESAFSVDNKFTEITLIHASENGYSEVYRALRHGKWHILKCLTDKEKDNPRYQQLLEKEFGISYLLSHPGIVHTLGMEEVEGLGACIIQEYIDGTTWDEFFQNNKVKKVERRLILSELCLALDYIHKRQIVHRDLTPRNIMITRDGHHPCIIDFGLADRDVFVVLKEPAGTSGYASPEQQVPGLLDNRSDIYSLGVLIDNITSKTDLRLRRIARKCMANNPEKRFVGAMEINRKLKPVKWWRWITFLAFISICAMALGWYTHGSTKEFVIAGLEQQLKIQKDSLTAIKQSMEQMSHNVDSIRSASKNISQRIVKEDRYAEALNNAKKELHTIAYKEYQRIWDSHAELADQPEDRRLTTNHEIYLVDWHPIVEGLVKKYNLSPNENKTLMDEWLIVIYNKVR